MGQTLSRLRPLVPFTAIENSLLTVVGTCRWTGYDFPVIDTGYLNRPNWLLTTGFFWQPSSGRLVYIMDLQVHGLYVAVQYLFSRTDALGVRERRLGISRKVKSSIWFIILLYLHSTGWVITYIRISWTVVSILDRDYQWAVGPAPARLQIMCCSTDCRRRQFVEVAIICREWFVKFYRDCRGDKRRSGDKLWRSIRPCDPGLNHL